MLYNIKREKKKGKRKQQQKKEATKMAETTIYCPDIECDSCVKAIGNVLKRINGMDKFMIKKNSIDISYKSDTTSSDEIIAAIKQKGYRASTEPFERKTFAERCRDFAENKKKYEVEYTMLKYSAGTFVLLLLIELIAYYGLFRSKSGFLQRYGWWILYLDLAVVSVGAAMWHLKSYKGQVTQMIGMMVGMTFGMQSGLMLGAIIGATNGIFVGGMTGMLAGTLVGWYNGRCCGAMGVLEGMMAGMMNGIMGSMIGVMFFADHVLWFMPFFIALNMIIMWGLSYMLFEEFVEDNVKVQKQTPDFMSFFSYCLIAVVIFIVIMIYAPKSGLARLV